MLGADLEDAFELKWDKRGELGAAVDALLEKPYGLVRGAGGRRRAAVDAHGQHAAAEGVHVGGGRDRPRGARELHTAAPSSRWPGGLTRSGRRTHNACRCAGTVRQDRNRRRY